ncbi:MAG: acetate/propionate family kinase [Akkermansiaceae bacterium]|jgi:acetate kinase|nr:acetate/propionate family kinase [Akkermansiaceae bacterium]MDP4647442.1 acetate/propionate family kinase [Akkermansiaceae bacterium]MDP4721702.1 acetate/propionate family kinase [Akkermansiaceae bacterium]MDP4781587.1 acetate/propionate family kinase [Akkermansiaceae bacterium]MDP4848048.1 acetate/propionate family kinase [Akkermansiaceae bacterium]
MLVLVANLGSTSFKYRLFRLDENGGDVVATGGYERVTDHASVIEDALAVLQKDGVIASPDEIEAVGFKTVLGKDLSGCVIADQKVIDALDGFTAVAPAHNPPYAAGIRQFEKALPKARLVALFETAFYQWTTPDYYNYAIPKAWRDIGIRRYGFHGASHKFIAERSAELCDRQDIAEIARRLYLDGPQSVSGKPFRVISCHLGGSSSVTGIRNGVAIGSSMGFSPQSGLPQNNRVGDLDSGAIPYAMRTLGISLDEAERQLTKESGLLGLSGVSNDSRDIEKAAAEGNADAQLAIDVSVHAIRHWIGAFLLDLGGLDALVFTAGIGENGKATRAAVCEALESFGIHLDPAKNAACRATEAIISSDDSPVKVIVIPANEELVLAREVYRKLS